MLLELQVNKNHHLPAMANYIRVWFPSEEAFSVGYNLEQNTVTLDVAQHELSQEQETWLLQAKEIRLIIERACEINRLTGSSTSSVASPKPLQGLRPE